MPRFRLTRAAAADLQEIDDYLSAESLAAAERVREALHQAIVRLVEFPELGHRREDLADEPLRFWAVDSYLIVYRPETSPLQVVRVVHAARDVRELLHSRIPLGTSPS